jgi:hypothetical protein
MHTESRFWKILPIVVTLITGAAPIYVSYDLFHRGSVQGSVPERRLELIEWPAINPLQDLNIKSGRVALRLSVGDETFDNMAIKRFTLTNTGEAPVVPSDYHEPISIRVKPPWRIIAVEHDFIIHGLSLGWHRVSDQLFEAKPALINPGDFMSQKVYLTDTKYKARQKSDVTPEVDLEISARITNMRQFITPAPATLSKFRPPKWFIVYLDGPAVAFTVISASIFLFWYLFLLQRAGLLALSRYKSCLTVIGLSVLSFSVAEVIAYYVFGGILSLTSFRPYPLNWRTNWHNWFILILHICVSIYLYRRSTPKPNLAVSADS